MTELIRSTIRIHKQLYPPRRSGIPRPPSRKWRKATWLIGSSVCEARFTVTSGDRRLWTTLIPSSVKCRSTRLKPMTCWPCSSRSGKPSARPHNLPRLESHRLKTVGSMGQSCLAQPRKRAGDPLVVGSEGRLARLPRPWAKLRRTQGPEHAQGLLDVPTHIQIIHRDVAHHALGINNERSS